MAAAAPPDGSSASQNGTVDATQLEDSAVVTSCHRTQINIDKFSVTWTIPNFSSRLEESGDNYINSPLFSVDFVENVQWMLKFYKSCFDCHVTLNGLSFCPEFDREGSRRYKVDLYISSVEDEKAYHQLFEEFQYYVNYDNVCKRVYGDYGFIRLEFLMNPVNGFLPDDKLTIICEVADATERIDLREPCYEHRIERIENILLEDFGSLFENQEFSDFTISVGSKELRVHKAILAARSPVYAAMFSHQMKENEENLVVITDIDYEVLREMMTYIYTGRSPNVAKMAEDLLVAADKYDLPGLKELCERVVHSKLTVENATSLLVLADMYSAKYLKPMIISFISKQAKHVIKTQGWKNITLTHSHLVAEAFEALASQEV